jgi:hypothetical protein
LDQSSPALEEQNPEKVSPEDTESIVIAGLVGLGESPGKKKVLKNIHRNIVESEPVCRQSALALTEEIENINKVLIRSFWGGNSGRMSAIGRSKVNG